MNRIILSGNLTRDPEVKYTKNGKAYAHASIAVQRKTKNPSGNYGVDFFDLTMWEKQAEFAGKYLHKGGRVIVEGRVETDAYKDKNGNDRCSFEIIVDKIEFGSSKKDSEPKNDEPDVSFDGEHEDDVPF